MRKKRFIAQIIPDKEWRKLGCSVRQAWNFMWMNCDEAGVFSIDEDRYEFENGGDEFPGEKLKEKLAEYLTFFDEKILIKSFISVHYGAKISPDYNPHKPLFRALALNNLKLDSSLNQAYLKLVDVDEDKEEDEEVYFGKSENLLKIEVDHETLIDLKKVQQEIKNEFTWKETICRNMTEVTNFTPDVFDNYLEQFFKQLENDGETAKSLQDTKKHFSRWLNIEIKKRDKPSQKKEKVNAGTLLKQKYGIS